MSVRLRNNKWLVDFYVNGRKGRRIQITLPEGIKTREEALEYGQLRQRETLQASCYPNRPKAAALVSSQDVTVIFHVDSSLFTQLTMGYKFL